MCDVSDEALEEHKDYRLAMGVLYLGKDVYPQVRSYMSRY